MKRTISIILTIILAFSLFGCKSDKPTEQAYTAATETDNGKKEQSKTESDKNDNETAPSETDNKSESDNEDKETALSETDNKSESDNEDNETVQNDNENQSVTEQTKLPENDQQTQQSDSADNDPQDSEQDSEGDAYTVLPKDIYTLRMYSTDTFLCTIVDKQPLKETVTFPLIGGYEQGAVLYTARIEKTYRSTFTSEDTLIYIVSKTNVDGLRWKLEYELNKKYLITGLVQPYKDEPIMVDTLMLCANIADDEVLVAQSYTSEKLLSKIKTLDDFENSSDVQKLRNHKYELISTIADDYTTQLEGASSDQEVIDYIKNAITLDK